MSLWSPTHVQFTVLRARNLIAKGKGGNNDVFATIQLGREKFQTSTIKNALNPEWFEECDLPIPHMHSVVEVTLYHRGLLSDDFLGYAAVPIWETKVGDTPRSSWVSLQSRPSSKSSEGKYRGELEVKLAFHCHSKLDFSQAGLKKRTSSIRNLASVFGDKFRFTRSRSLRENRRDPEGEKMDRLQQSQSGESGPVGTAEGEENLTRSYSMSAAYIKSMSLERGPRVFHGKAMSNGSTAVMVTTPSNSGIADSTTTSTSTTTTTTSNAHMKDTNGVRNVGSSLDRLQITGSLDWTDTSPSHNYSQSVYNLPGERRSCAPELLPSRAQNFPLAKCTRSQSQDDSALSVLLRNQHTNQLQSNRVNRGRTMSDILIGSSHNCIGSFATSPATSSAQGANSAFVQPTPHVPPSTVSGQLWRDQLYATIGGGGGIYESIKERTEPENSVSSSSPSSSDGESVPKPKSKRPKRPQKRVHTNVPIMGKDKLLLQQQQQVQQLYRQPYRHPNSSNAAERAIYRCDLSPSKANASPFSSAPQHPLPPPPLPPFRPTPRPNSYPNSSVPFSPSSPLDSSQQTSEQLQSFNVRDSGIIEDPSSSQGNSLEGSGLTTPDCVSISGLPATTAASTFRNGSTQANTSLNLSNLGGNHHSTKSMVLDPTSSGVSQLSKPGGGGILFHLDQELALSSSRGHHQTESVPGERYPSFPGHWHRRENSQGELVIRKRSRGERDRLRQARQAQGGRRYTVQNVESCPPGAYSDSQSEASASPRQEVSDSLMSVYSNMNKEELLRAVIQAKAQMIRKDQYIRDLETYIDDLLVRVMETTPRLLNKPNLLRL